MQKKLRFNFLMFALAFFLCFMTNTKETKAYYRYSDCSGNCKVAQGSGKVTWNYTYSTKTLTLSGTGTLEDDSDESTSPIGQGIYESLYDSNSHTSDDLDIETIQCASGAHIYVSGGAGASLFSGQYTSFKNLKTIKLSGFDFSGCTSAYSMFRGQDYNENRPTYYSKLTTISGLSDADFRNVKDADFMFYECRSLATAGATTLSLPKATFTYQMFKDCVNMTAIPKVTTNTLRQCGQMFANTKATSIDISGLKFDATNGGSADSLMAFTNISSFTWPNTINSNQIYDFSGLFKNCQNLTTVDLTYLNTTGVQDRSGLNNLFEDCPKLTSVTFGSNFTAEVLDAAHNSGSHQGNKLFGSSTAFEKLTKIVKKGSTYPIYVPYQGDVLNNSTYRAYFCDSTQTLLYDYSDEITDAGTYYRIPYCITVKTKINGTLLDETTTWTMTSWDNLGQDHGNMFASLPKKEGYDIAYTGKFPTSWNTYIEYNDTDPKNPYWTLKKFPTYEYQSSLISSGIVFDTTATATKYTINYQLNGGTNNSSNPAQYTIETNTITLANPTKPGYIFSKWTATSSASAAAVTSIPKGSTGNKTFYAQWTACSSHTFGSPVTTKAPTCSATGTQTETCSKCGYVKTTTLDMIAAHTYGTPAITFATDGKTATWVQTCSVCSTSLANGNLSLGSGITSSVKTVATCNAKGTTTYTATATANSISNVATKDVQDIAINPANHVGGTEIRGAKTATCSEEGYTGDTHCKGCGAKISTGTTINKIAHTPGSSVNENVIAPTCTEDGSHDEVIRCTVCQAQISSAHKVDKALGHDFGKWTVTKEATESESGSEERYCQREGCQEKEIRDIPPLTHQHNLTEVAEKASTCAVAGNIKYYVCDTCHKIFADDQAQTEIEIEDIQKELTAHTPGEPSVANEIASTCLLQGSYDEVVKCSVCGAVISTQHYTTDPLGHSFGEWTVTKEPTETETGLKERTCQRDGCMEKETDIIPAIEKKTGFVLTLHPNGADLGFKEMITDANGKAFLPALTKNGYVFKGWTMFDIVVDNDTVYTEDTDLYAMWEKETDQEKPDSTEEKPDSTDTKTDTDKQEPSKEKEVVVSTNDGKAEIKVTDQGAATVEFVDKKQKEITIPSKIEKDGVSYEITEVNQDTFKNARNVEVVRIEEGVTTIKQDTFKDMSKLKEVYLPSTVTVIEKGAFKNDTALCKIVIPDSVTKISESTFEGCKKLSSVKMKKVTVIEKNAFKGCTSLKSIKLPASIKEIKDSAFENSSLTSIVLGKNVKKIGKNVFKNCKKLKKVTFKSTKLKKIGKNTFTGCHKDLKIKVPKKQFAKYKKLLKKAYKKRYKDYKVI